MTPIDVITIAALGGLIPALIWLWFWIREDEHPEPWQYIVLVFVLGMIMVPIVIPFQKTIEVYTETLKCVAFIPLLTYFLWAGLEEVFKYAAAYFAALRNPVNDEPIDPVIYMIVAALGFAALENTLYLIDPVSQKLVVDSVVIANLRFIGATLLHVVSSAIVGIFLAYSFYKPVKEKIIYLILGLFFATLLHAMFNVVLISEKDIGGPIAALFITWIAAMILIITFEKVKKIKRKKDFHSNTL